MNNINEILESEKQQILKENGLQNKLRTSAWDKVDSKKIIHFRTNKADRTIELTKKMPLLTHYMFYTDSVAKNIQNDKNSEIEFINFLKTCDNDELQFFLSQMTKIGETSWFVYDFCFKNPNIHNAINDMMLNGENDKVRTMFAFCFDDILELRLTENTHPNSFSAYAEGKCNNEITKFMDTYLNTNSQIFNDYLNNVEIECLKFKTPEEFFREMTIYNNVKQFDFDNLINNPVNLYKSFLIYKKLNQLRVNKTNNMLSLKEFKERDEKRRKYDDFDPSSESVVTKFYDELSR